MLLIKECINFKYLIVYCFDLFHIKLNQLPTKNTLNYISLHNRLYGVIHTEMNK